MKKLKMPAVMLAVLAAVVLTLCAPAEAATDWTTNKIEVTGMGVPNPRLATTPAHAAMMARRAAMADAYRQLAEAVNGVQVDSETTVEQMMLTSDVVKTRITATIRGAQIVSEGELAGGGYSVTLELPLFGEGNSIAETVLERPAKVEPFPLPAPEYRPPVARPSYGGYTGLVVDCRGMNINFVMSPVIKNINGQKIYGHQNLDYDRVIREGMASYAQDMNQAARAGAKPLVVKAVWLDDLNANPVLSAEDADLVLYENSQSHFLDNIAVVFLY